MHAQDKADILARNWKEAHRFSGRELNLLGWKIPFDDRFESPIDFVKSVDCIWEDLIKHGWSEEEAVEAMLRPSGAICAE